MAILRYLFFSLCTALLLFGIGKESGAADFQRSGHLRGQGLLSWPDHNAVMQDADLYTDAVGELRLKGKIDHQKSGFEIHYEALYLAGETQKNRGLFRKRYPGFPGAGPVDDDRRLFDLTHTLHEEDDSLLYHRLDRLSYTRFSDWGTLTLGRQALTWGNGMVFNPMDLFNPFAPTDFNRDYKMGDDMALVQFPTGDMAELQLLAVPRRNPENREIETDESSVAGKFHFAKGVSEFDLMAAHHYGETVIGAGARGYLKNAAWRMDGVWTFLDKEADEEGFFAFTANIDYSWNLLDKNFYGLLEYCHNGLGEEEIEDAYEQTALVERLARGEIHTLGRNYLSGQIQMEAHPLVNLYLLAISELQGPSAVLQPRMVWDAAQSLRCILGATLYAGETGTEYGGFPVKDADLVIKPADTAFVWITWFF